MKKWANLGLSALLAFCAPQLMAEEATTSATAEQPVASAQVAHKTAAKVDVNLVNINTATASELQDKLVGIGAKKAQAIVEYREKNGKFLSVEQLTEVSGIGKATLDKNRDRIVLE